jgi:hypothetical protein
MPKTPSRRPGKAKAPAQPLTYPDPHVKISPLRELTKAEWKALALEAGSKLASAVAHIPGKHLLSFNPDGSTTPASWEDDVVLTLEKFPGARIDREALGFKYLNARERVKFNKARADERSAWMREHVPQMKTADA